MMVVFEDHEGLAAEDGAERRVDGDHAGVVTLVGAHGGLVSWAMPPAGANGAGALC
jgi:hypothetical protein